MRRLRLLAKHLTAPRGLLILGAAATAIAGIVIAATPAQTILFVVSALLATVVLLLISLRLSELNSRVGHLEKNGAPATKVQEREPTSVPEPPRTEATFSSSPVVSIVIPAFNEEERVAEAIASVRAQTFTDWECIVVDDASTDGSLRVMSEATEGDSRFRLVRQRVNGGLSASRNTGLGLALGQFVAFLDADDLLLPTSLEDRLSAMASGTGDPHVVGSYTGVTYRQGTRLEDLPMSISWPEEERRTIDFVNAEGECPFPVMAPLSLTETLRRLGGFDESMREGAEDWDLWQRTLRNGYVFVPGRAKTAVYRQRPDSMVRLGSGPHARIGMELIEQSHHEAMPSEMRAPSATPLPLPLGWYTKSIAQSRRAIRSAAMSRVSGDDVMANDLMMPVRDLPLALLERHVDVEDEVRRGLTRAGEIVDEQQLADVVDWVKSRFAAGSMTATSAGRTVGLLLIPQHSDHLARMIEYADNFADSNFEVLLVEREGAAQGVAEKLPSGAVRHSLSEWALSGATCEVALVGQVRSAVVEEVALGLSKAGSRVIEIPDAYAEWKAIPEAPPRIAALDGSDPTRGDSKGTRARTSVVERWPAEEDPLSRVDFDLMQDLRNRYRGERAVVIGNGPSLNQLDLTMLKPELTFGVNGIFYAAEQMGFSPTFYVVEDSAVVDDNLAAIRSYDVGTKLFPSVYRPKIGEIPGASYFMMNRSFYAPDSPNFCVPNFATDCTQQVFCGQSVTIINLQLAYHMGFTEVVLIGMDFSYTIPDDAEQTGYQILSQGPDPNHFHPDYFGKGKVWKQPKLDRVLASYALAKQVFEADDRRIVNSTVGGQLHLFERVPYTEVLR